MDSKKISDLIRPGMRMTELSKPQIQQIFAAARTDASWFENLSQNSKKDVLKSLRRGESDASMWRVALIARNSVTADSALAGAYNEWDLIKKEVLNFSEQPRSFFAVLRTIVLIGIEPVVWSVEPYRHSSVMLMRASVKPYGNQIKISEFWPVGQNSQKYPAVEVYDPTLG